MCIINPDRKIIEDYNDKNSPDGKVHQLPVRTSERREKKALTKRKSERAQMEITQYTV